jgi:hypothetical protein
MSWNIKYGLLLLALQFNPWVFFDQSVYNLGLNRQEFALALFGIVILLFVNFLQNRYKNITIRAMIIKQNIVFRHVFYLIAIAFIVVFGVYGPEYNTSQFIYFQF